jgi:hypothetical protein
MCRNWFVGLGALSLLVLVGATAHAQYNPSGFVQTHGWNFLGPLLNPLGAGPSLDAMKCNWVGPRNLPTEDPKAGTQWTNINFTGGCSPSESRSPGFNMGGLAPSPIWYTVGFLEAAFGITIARQNRVNYGQSGDAAPDGLWVQINAEVVPTVPGASNLPLDNVLAIATTYVRNNGPGLLVDLCTGSDDSIQVWVNNVCVLNKSIPRGYGGGCQELTPAILPSGVSKIAALVWEGGGGHNLGLGIRLPGATSNLADGNGVIEFLGAGGPNDTGQIQYGVSRSFVTPAYNCPPKQAVPVTIQGDGTGDAAEVVTVVENISVSNPALLTISNVSHGGVVTDLLPPPPPAPDAPPVGQTPVGDFDDARRIGTHCGALSATTYDMVEDEYTSVSNSGGDLWDGANDFEFAYKQLEGDFDISIEMTSKAHNTNAGRWGKFGLIARRSLSGCSRHTIMQDHMPDLQDARSLSGRTGHNQCGTMYEERDTTGPAVSAHPNFYRLTRRGTIIRGYASDDTSLRTDPTNNALWTRIGREDNWGGDIPDALFVGFANSEHGDGGCNVQTIKFKLLHCSDTGPLPPQPIGKTITWVTTRGQLNEGLSYSVQYGAAGSTNHAGMALNLAIVGGPSSVVWNPNQSGPVGPENGECLGFENSHDIGSVPTMGSTTFAGGVYTIKGSGSDIWDGGDHMHITYRAVTGDFQATARVVEVQNPPNARWGRYGIMARYTCDRGSKYSMACVPYRGEDPNVGGAHGVAGNDSKRHQSRRDHLTDGTTRDNQEMYRAAYDAQDQYLGWIRLTRRGKYFYSEFANDEGGKPGEWVLVGGDTHTNPPDTLLLGFVSSSHGTGGANLLSVDFDNWCVEEPPALPSQRCAPEDGVIDEDFEGEGGGGGLGANTVVNVGSGAWTPAVVVGRLRLTEDGIGSSAVAVYFDTDGENLGDHAWVAHFDGYYSKAGAGDPADGFVFAVTEGNFASATGLVGGGGGAAGYERGGENQIPPGRRNSWGVEIDNWNGGHGHNDPNNRHIGVNFHEQMQSAQHNVEFGVAVPTIFQVPEGNHFEVRYIPNGDSSLIDVWVTDNAAADPPSTRRKTLSVIGPRIRGDAVIGFTGGTGGANARQEIDNFTLSKLCCEDNADSVSIAGPSTSTVGEGVTLTAVFEGADGPVSYTWSAPGASLVDHGDGTATVTCDAVGDVVVTVSANDGVCSAEVSAQHTLTCSQAGVGPFIRGDCNGDGQFAGQVTDAVFLLNFNFVAGAPPPCRAACDANGDGQFVGQVTDAVYMLQFNFLGGPAPPAPYPGCGTSSLASDIALGCETPTTGRPPLCP